MASEPVVLAPVPIPLSEVDVVKLDPEAYYLVRWPDGSHRRVLGALLADPAARESLIRAGR